MDSMDPISPSADSRAVALARRVLRIEAAAVAALADRVGEEFERAVDIILKRHCLLYTSPSPRD